MYAFIYMKYLRLFTYIAALIIKERGAFAVRRPYGWSTNHNTQ